MVTGGLLALSWFGLLGTPTAVDSPVAGAIDAAPSGLELRGTQTLSPRLSQLRV